MKKHLKQDIQTTLSGALPGIALLIYGILEKNVANMLEGLGLILLGFAAKDKEA